MRRIAVRAIIVDGNKLLLARLNSSTSNTSNEYYCTIGGGLDDNEGLIDGLKREVLEETGVIAKVGKLLCVQQYKDKHDNIEFFFYITNGRDFRDIALSKTTHGQQEISEIGFYDPTNIHVLPQFISETSVLELLNTTDVRFYNYL